MTKRRKRIETDVVDQLHRVSAINKDRITLDSEVYKDLGIYGMDLYEAVSFLATKYGTKFHEFPMLDYCPPEGVLWPWQRRRAHRDKYKSLTVRHLVEVVDRGAWFDENSPAPKV